MTFQALAGFYLVLTFVMLKFSFEVAVRLIRFGAIVGALMLIKPFRAEISMIIVIIATAWIIKRFLLRR